MPGITSRQYASEIMKFNKSLKAPLNLIKSVLPYEYNQENIFTLFEELYPHELEIIKQRHNLYKAKDDFLVKIGKKERYKPISPQFYLYSLPKVKHILSEGQKELHRENFNQEEQIDKLKKLREKRKKKISKLKQKVDYAQELIQEIEPLYIDIFINGYHRKGSTIDEKMEIVKELQKYECEKSLDFFYKLNDSERNTQIRIMAHNHLQSLGRYVKQRKSFKGKKKSYMSERTSFDMKPLDLLQRIETDSIQNKKTFDYFISHSFLDNELVKEIIKSLNKSNLHVYCDWFNDTDFLKRQYAGEYTEIVLQKRIQQSKKVLFIRTKNTNDLQNNFFSKWVQMEILYAKELNKEIECIDMINDGNCEFKLFENYKHQKGE